MAVLLDLMDPSSIVVHKLSNIDRNGNDWQKMKPLKLKA
jgi:hypothetical protein